MSTHFVLRRSSRKKRTEGLLDSYLPALTQALRTQCYQRDTIRRYLHAVDPFAQWLTAHHLTVAEIEETVVARYIASQGYRTIRTTGHKHRPQTTVGLSHLLHVLRAQGVIAPPSPRVPTTPTEPLLATYDHHLTRVQGAAPRTRHKYLYFARQFLQAAFPTGTLAWATLDAERITTIVQHQTRGRRGFGRKHPGVAIRIFLRYLVLCNLLPDGLEAAVPGMRVWTHAVLPARFSPEEVGQILTTSADGTASGRRNHALLLLLARLGLRALEAAHLQLDDIDWHNGTVLVRAQKTRRERVLPLPDEVGQALVAYLQDGRPVTTYREIFLTHTVPYLPLQTASAVTHLVKRVVARSGLARHSAGAHLFRHTAATDMLRQGVSFKAIADVLGHHSLQTTGIYAKLDLPMLAQVALPWPGGAQ
jgi:site-specific recombinase XerD